MQTAVVSGSEVLCDDVLEQAQDLGSGSFRSEPCDKADELESNRADVWRRISDDAQDRHPAGHVPCHAADDLPGEGLAIEVPLSGHDKVGNGDVLVQADEVSDELEPRDDLGS